MSAERVLLKEIMIYFAKGDITIRKFENSGDIAETFHSVQELLAQPEEELYQKLLRIEDGIEVEILPSELWQDGYETGKRTMQPEQDQEPVAWMNDSGGCFLSDGNKYSENWTALYTEPKQPESTAEAIMPNGVCISNVYAAYEAGRKSVMSEQEPLTNEQKSAEAALEQALRDSIDTEKLMQILKDGGILTEVGEQK